jgi:hypothetical protein
LKELYYNTKLLWGVFLDEDKGNYYIEVECGGVAMYSVRIPLNKEEVEMFNQKPENLNGLAYDIARNPEKFEKERSVNALKK